MPWKPRTCDVCETSFVPHSYQQLRCSRTCMDEAARQYQGARARPDQLGRYNRFAHLRRKYGLSEERYAEMLAAQDGGCAICGGGNGGRHLEVDHDHTCCPGDRSCGRCVRGLLCGPCNKVLGHVSDNPARLRAAVAYLEAYGVAS